MSFVVRAPRAADARAIAVLRNRVWRCTYPGMVDPQLLDSLDDERSTVVWEGRLALVNSRGTDHNGITLRVAVDMATERVVGMGEVTPAHGPPASAPQELTMFNIDPGYRRQGLGARLLSVLTGARDCSAWVVAANTQALAFFTQHGFHQVDEHRVQPKFGVPEVLMLRQGWSAPGL